jgi:hypothetical protein
MFRWDQRIWDLVPSFFCDRAIERGFKFPPRVLRAIISAAKNNFS